MKTLVLFTALYASAAGQTTHSPNTSAMETSESKVMNHILHMIPPADQKLSVRPVRHAQHPIHITISLFPFHILEFDQTKQKLTTQAWLRLKWNDFHIKWNPDHHEGITRLPIDNDLIWTPDIMLLNTYGDTKPIRLEQTPAQVYHDGNVTWVIMVILNSFCKVKLEDFPYDIQLCSLHFGSWTYSESKMKLRAADFHGIHFENYVENVEWYISNSSVTQGMFDSICCEEMFEVVSYNFYLKRWSGYYAGVVLLPVMVLSVMCVFTYCIPAQRPDRIAVGLSLYTSFILLLMLVVSLSPPSETSKLSTYLIVCVGIVTSCIMVSIILIQIASWRGNVPKCIKKGFVEPMSKVLFPIKYRHIKKEQIDSDQNVPEWVAFTLVADRALFVVYLILLIICIGLYFPKKYESTVPVIDTTLTINAEY